MHLAFVDWRITLQKMNAAIVNNDTTKNSQVKCFREDEILIVLGLLIGSIDYGTRGKDLWVTTSH